MSQAAAAECIVAIEAAAYSVARDRGVDGRVARLRSSTRVKSVTIVVSILHYRLYMPSCRIILVERARGPSYRALTHALWLLELAPPLLSRGALPRQCGIRTTNALDLFAYEVEEE